MTYSPAKLASDSSIEAPELLPLKHLHELYNCQALGFSEKPVTGKENDTKKNDAHEHRASQPRFTETCASRLLQNRLIHRRVIRIGCNSEDEE